ncbi:MAG TPA: phosphatidate cytidylyltransferase [Longimicrobiales bacterium]|nr:phosphatidate cytidylyltransferase [Longimicrobiales bacterium]
MASELTRRVAVAAVGIPLALVVIWAGGSLLALLLAAIAAGAAVELYRLAGHRGIRAFTAAGALLAATPILITGFNPDPYFAGAWSWGAFVLATLLVAAAAIFLRGVDGSPLAVSAVTITGALFTGGTLAHAVLLRELTLPTRSMVPGLPEAELVPLSPWLGPALLLFPLVLTWTSDTAAYFGGRSMGRRKLIPAVSPGKTVEGAIAGVVGTVIVGALYGHFVFHGLLHLPLGVGFGLLAGLIISPVAQVGDLAESLLKREAGVKDSGNLLPGHGGMLDRFDSLFFTIPATYWLLELALLRMNGGWGG